MYTASSTQSGRMGIFLISMLCSRHWNTKGPWYSEGFVSTMNILACVCSTIRRGGWANAGESPGLSCCCTSPPREILTFPAQPTFCPAFLSGESLEELKQQSWEKKRQWASRLLPSASSSSIRLHFFLSFPQHIGGGGGVRIVLELMWSGESSKQKVCAVPPCYTVTMYRQYSRCHCILLTYTMYEWYKLISGPAYLSV